MIDFTYRSYPTHVIFGKGKFGSLPGFLQECGKVLIIGSPRVTPLVNQLKQDLGRDDIPVFSNIVQHVPRDIVDEATALAKRTKAEVLVAIGGGSAIGLAKALALESEVTVIAVPTTYSGSEQTNIWGITTAQGKTTGKSDKVLPGFVVYDPDLTASMPLPLAVASAMNAMAHLVEAIYAPDGNPVTRHQALQGIKTLRTGLITLAGKQTLPEDANENILFGAYLAGKCLCEVSMSLHHKTAHVLGGTFGLDHAGVHTVLLPYALQYQWQHLSGLVKDDFKTTLGSNPMKALMTMAKQAGAPSDLKSLGYEKSDIEKTANEILARPYANVAPLEKQDLVTMLEAAWRGQL